MGVFDDDRPKQHKLAPVRCLEAELVPALPAPAAGVCTRCALSPRQTGKTMCGVCHRAVDLSTRSKRRALDQRAEARVIERADKAGWVIPAHYDAHTIERMVEDGRLRWLSDTERRRYGLEKFYEVAVKVLP
jgi:hypothetical protein